jgi:hypothetical protein
MKRFLLLAFFSLTIGLANAVTVWTASCPGTWSGSPYPFFNGTVQATSANISNGDIFLIPNNCTITISGNVVMSKDLNIQLNGTLYFPTSGDKIDFTANTIILAGPTGKISGVSNSNQIRIGSGSPEWDGPGTLNGPFIITNGFLPIELIEFKGNCAQKTINLNWKTATETNNDHFELERSVDAVNYYKVADITSLAPNGTSMETLQYNYTDLDVNAPIYYYRLIQVDKNGESKMAAPISVKVLSTEFSIYPNPNSGTFSIDLPTVEQNETLTLVIYNSVGQKVYESTQTVLKDNPTARTDINPTTPLPKGMYTTYVNFAGSTSNLKLVVH